MYCRTRQFAYIMNIAQTFAWLPARQAVADGIHGYHWLWFYWESINLRWLNEKRKSREGIAQIAAWLASPKRIPNDR